MSGPLRAAAALPSIALFTYSTLPRGSVVHTAALADALADAGWPVTVYALDKDGRGFFRPLRADLRLVPAGPAPATTAALVRQRAGELAAYLAAHPGAAAHDIHHAEDCLTASGLLLARETWPHGDPPAFVRTVHHVERFEDPDLARCQQRSIRRADACFAVSADAQRDVAGTFGVSCAVVGNGVDLGRAAVAAPARREAWRRRLEGRRPLVLAVGGVEERKNTLGTLRAFARLRAAHPRAQLWIVGGASVLDHGRYRAAFDAARAALDAETRAAIVELGVIPDEDLPALYAEADALALPSLHEGFGLTALEALAAGLPLVASRRPPFTEYLDEELAELVDPLSDEEIAAGLARALAASPARRAAGRRRAAAYSWPRVAAAHARQYLAVYSTRPSHPSTHAERMTHARDALRRSVA